MIQIIDGFKLNASTPIDSRFVVADDTERMAITYLYHGLRVWQLDTNIPYFYDGTQWISELDLVVTGSGTLNSIPKIIDGSPVEIGDSQISDDGTTVTITNDLDVGGEIKFTSLDGVIDADKITMGTLTLDRLETGTDGYVLQMEGGVPKWNNLSGITIGTSENSEKVTVDGTTSVDYRLILRLDSSSVPNPTLLYSNTNGLKLRQDGTSELRILAHDGAVDFPSYSFDSSVNSGIYYNSGIYLSINGNNKARFNNSGINFYDFTQFYFTQIPDRLYIYDTSNKTPTSNASLDVYQSGSQFNSASVKTARFRSGDGNVFIAPSNVGAGYSFATNDGDSVIKAENTTGGLVLAAKSPSSPGWDGIRIWEGKLQVGTKGTENYSVHIKENSTDYSLVVDDTFYVKPNEIQMLGKTYEQYVVANDEPDGGTSTCWVTNLVAGSPIDITIFGDIRSIFTASDPYDYTMPSVDYDRYITIKFGADVSAQYSSIGIFVENGVGTKDFVDTSFSYAEFDLSTKINSAVTAAVDYSNEGSTSKVSALVPANCRWAGYLNMVDNSGLGGIKPKAVVTIQRFGIQ